MSIDVTYATQIRNETGKFAAWFPNAHIRIGDYGTVSGPLFQRLSHLDDVASSYGPAKAAFDFNINADRSINVDAKAAADAGVTKGNVLLEVSFHSEAAVSFSAPDATISTVDDLVALGQRLVGLGGDKWKRRDYYIVCEVVTAPRATILIAQKAGAEMKFEVTANTPINPTVMANLDSNSSLRVHKGVNTKIVGEGPLTPLFRLAHLKSHLFKEPEIRIYRGAGEAAPEKIYIDEIHYLEIY
jgi:hypothetical protein